ncbi:hypothetical protein AGLY_014398 [Aphis glycines]|uniref:Uncharacterized protein n=1 Tax=Aphis glycines TaxID=307491 RepID=A0A6G0T3J7_APHGL|nr:hypothetical protein AGLY_014398 [Aphis glycines]
MCSGQQSYKSRVFNFSFFFQLKNLHFLLNYTQIVDNTTQIMRWCRPRRYYCRRLLYQRPGCCPRPDVRVGCRSSFAGSSGRWRTSHVEGVCDQAHDRPISNDVVDVPDAAGQVTATSGHCGAEEVKQLAAHVSQAERDPATDFGQFITVEPVFLTSVLKTSPTFSTPLISSFSIIEFAWSDVFKTVPLADCGTGVVWMVSIFARKKNNKNGDKSFCKLCFYRN